MDEDAAPRATESRSAEPTTPTVTVEVYETVDGVVLYDAGNPLAWIESRHVVALDDAV